MKKQKIITITIITLIIILLVVLFAYGNSNSNKIDINVPQVDLSTPTIDSVSKIQGNKEDLLSFSILPDTKVSGILSYRGSIKGGYFFEANILINILDLDKKILKASNGIAVTDWMTVEAVDFEGNIDFTGLSKGPAYFEIKNDNPAGPDEGVNKSILIPIIIE